MNAILQYMQGLLNGLPIPANSKALTTFIVPPTQKQLDGPIAMLLPSPAHGERRTAPRGMGSIEIPWWIDVYLKYETNPNSQLLDQQFALIVDAILYKCWGVKLPLQITDPTTTVVSNLIALGEAFEVEPQPVETPASMRMLLFTGLVRIEAKEWVQA